MGRAGPFAVAPRRQERKRRPEGGLMEAQEVDGKRKADAHAIGDTRIDASTRTTDCVAAADAPRSSNEPRNALSANDANASRKKLTDWARAHPKGLTMVYANVWLLFTLIPIIQGLLAENGIKKYLFLTLIVTFDIVYFRVWLVYPSVPTSERGFSPGLLDTIAALIALETMAAFFADGGNVQLLIFVSSVIAYTTSGRARALALAGLLAFAALQTTLLVRLGKTSLQEGVTSFALLCVLTITFYAVGGTIAFHKELEIKNKKIEQLTQKAERERIGSDLHDILGQTLTAIALKTQLSARLLDMPDQRERTRRELLQAAALAHQALADVRAVVRDARRLRPDEEILAARELLCAAGITPVIRGEPIEVGEQAERVLAHVVREAVANVVHHAAATRCVIATRASGVRIEDDGVRLPDDASKPAVKAPASGLAGLDQRVREAGGVLSYGRLKRGWAVEARFDAGEP